MPVYKNKTNGTWYVVTQYTDWTGERKPKCKRGFATKTRSAGMGAEISAADLREIWICPFPPLLRFIAGSNSLD